MREWRKRLWPFKKASIMSFMGMFPFCPSILQPLCLLLMIRIRTLKSDCLLAFHLIPFGFWFQTQIKEWDEIAHPDYRKNLHADPNSIVQNSFWEDSLILVTPSLQRFHLCQYKHSKILVYYCYVGQTSLHLRLMSSLCLAVPSPSPGAPSSVSTGAPSPLPGKSSAVSLFPGPCFRLLGSMGVTLWLHHQFQGL